ncbi:MAG: phosphatidate cytidylyltransferase [Epulopiscium sp.]|nr:phosphatidate cytidylyltransferase [Candidatus Epulonipiscium sp.]
MRVRIITAILGIPLLLGIIIVGGWVLKAAVCFISLVGIYEFYRAMDKKVNTIKPVGYVFTLSFILFTFPKVEWYFAFMVCFLFCIFLSIIFFHEKYTIIDGAITFIGFFYICVLFSYILKVRNYAYGDVFIWLIFISAWGSDTGAYFTGITIGKHKLCPNVSPKKTIEGALGGVVGGALLALLYGGVLLYFRNISIPNFLMVCAVIGAMGAIISQLGDLTASSIKRLVDIKDYGKLFPGHGGVLDRFDSILFTAPLVYYLIVLADAYLKIS